MNVTDETSTSIAFAAALPPPPIDLRDSEDLSTVKASSFTVEHAGPEVLKVDKAEDPIVSMMSSSTIASASDSGGSVEHMRPEVLKVDKAEDSIDSPRSVSTRASDSTYYMLTAKDAYGHAARRPSFSRKERIFSMRLMGMMF